MNYIGIDPGLSGAIAVINDKGKFLTIEDIPAMLKDTKTGTVKKCINSKQLQNLLCAFTAEFGEIKAIVENVTAMPGQGVASMFSLGDTFGCIKTALVCENIDYILVNPQVWKKHFKLTHSKDESVHMACRLYPDARHYLTRKKDHNRAEALLLARYLYVTLNRTVGE